MATVTPMKTTLFVAMVTYDGVIDLPQLSNLKAVENFILEIKPSNMNKNKNIITSIILDIKIDKIPRATVHIYAPRINILVKERIDEISLDITKILGDIKHAINKKKNEIIVTFYTFGNYNNILEIEDHLMTNLEPKYANYFKSVESFFMKAHIKGTKAEDKIEYISDKIESFFKDNIYSKSLVRKELYFSLVNSTYNIKKRIAIYELASNIKSITGFEQACVVYDNLHNAGMVTITIPWNDEYEGKLWRKDNECTYTIRAVGIITQSTPSIQYQEKVKDLLMGAFEKLKNIIFRE